MFKFNHLVIAIFVLFLQTTNAGDIYQLSNRSEIKTYQVSDNKQLDFRFYPATNTHKQNIIYLHGIESHSGWFDKAALQLNALGYSVYALDRRGSGLNRENRGFIRGHVEHYDVLFDDINHFIDSQSFTKKPIIVGLSWGGKLALSYNIAFPEKIESLILITPGLISLVDVGILDKIQIFWSSYFSSSKQFKLPIQPQMFTTTPYYLDYIKQDPLRNDSASASFLMQSRDLDGYIIDNIAKNPKPTLLFLAGNDQIIDNVGVVQLLQENANNEQPLTIIDYPEQTHSIQFDATEQLVKDINAWITLQPSGEVQ